MGTITQEKRMRNYFKIYEQIYMSPPISLYDISVNTGLSRNTVSKYLKEMYAKDIIRGPQMRMRPAPTYREYVYLMNFTNPYQIFIGLNQFPHVLYYAVTFGDWNTMLITDRLLDFKKLVGFQTMVIQGVRYRSYTPKVEYTSWDESFKKVYDQLTEFTSRQPEFKCRQLTPLPWGEDQWKLYHAFTHNMRKKVTPLLKKINVRYETYTEWMKTLHNHCTIHTGFYPEGYQNYSHYCFLLYTDHEHSVQSLLSHFPPTPFIMEVDNQLLGFITVTSPDITRALFSFIYDMKTKDIIKGFHYSTVLFHSHPNQKLNNPRIFPRGNYNSKKAGEFDNPVGF